MLRRERRSAAALQINNVSGIVHFGNRETREDTAEYIHGADNQQGVSQRSVTDLLQELQQFFLPYLSVLHTDCCSVRQRR